MPGFSSATLAGSPAAAHTANSSTTSLQVVCAWPVSGQYGPGSRVLYYVLVAACVFARRREWLRNACLAAALIFPAVAAIHGLVLASLHVNGAVDMDVYGAFQLCSIGILAAPLTVRLSRTYFYDPGRNIIFLWTGLVLAGLLSLTVEFYRVTTHPCSKDDHGNPLPSGVANFPYGNATCNLACSVDAGPTSLMRTGATNEIFVIPAPSKLTFNTGMLLAAACCIPAILSLIFTWDKILEINWKKRSGNANDDAHLSELIEGTNGATVGRMKGVDGKIRYFLSVIEIPLFAAAVLAILILGETNFFSDQVRYQTEPMASIGQWSPIAGTVIAALGSLYVLRAVSAQDSGQAESDHHCNCQHCQDSGRRLTIQIPPRSENSLGRSVDGESSGSRSRSSNDTRPMATHPMSNSTSRLERFATSSTVDTGGRRRAAQWLTKAGDYLGTAAQDRFDLAAFDRGRAREYPETPGESRLNRELAHTKQNFNRRRKEVIRRQRSRESNLGTPASPGLGITFALEDAAERPSPTPRSSSRSPPGSSILEIPQRRRTDTLEVPTPPYFRT
ncbi:hypothetical protein EJ04DRAFT_36890 [Polyplosphaeria fusca]|uniref:Uncharacterized protein n=1 Tax=Polyplosphaeria fusca TaxID=682080 RepID=A0A9P4QS17_9PLEO|nr:hypothetical protein EJ04DRAFT_36890 [Polyplosphaeria fusca]